MIGLGSDKKKILEDLSTANSKFSYTSAGIVFFAKAQGKQSSMHGYRPKSGPRTSSHSGKRGTTHHGGLICLQTDGNFANHTTEMILRSMILTVHHQSFPHDKSEIRQQIGEQKHGIILTSRRNMRSDETLQGCIDSPNLCILLQHGVQLLEKYSLGFL